MSDSHSRPSVVFVTMIFEPEPGNVRGLPLASWLARNGYDVKVITGFPNYPSGRIYPGYRTRLWQWEEMDGVRVLRVPIYPSHDMSALRRILTYTSIALTSATIGAAAIGKADIVYLYDPPPTLGLASLVLKVFRVARVVHHVGDIWPESVTESGLIQGGISKRLVFSIMRRWCTFLYRRADWMTVLSPGFKALLVERGAHPDRTDIIYNWADESRFTPADPDPTLRRDLGLEGKVNAIYAGNIGPLQAIDNAIRAAALLRDHPTFQLVIIGTGPLEQEMKQFAAELGTTNVRFISRRPVSEMNAINALADGLLISLRDIPFMAATIPSKTQVAMASARPIVMAVKGDAADLVTRAGAGICAPPDDPEALASAFRRLTEMTPTERQDMGLRGRRFYEEHLSLDVGARRMGEILSRVLPAVGGRTLPGHSLPVDGRSAPASGEEFHVRR